MSDDQRAIVADKLATLKLGTNQFSREGTSNEGPSLTVDQAAQRMKVSKVRVERVRRTRTQGGSNRFQRIASPNGETTSITQCEAEKLVNTLSAKAGGPLPKTFMENVIKNVRKNAREKKERTLQNPPSF